MEGIKPSALTTPRPFLWFCAIALILVLAGFFGYGLAYVNEGPPGLSWSSSPMYRELPQAAVERRERLNQAYLDSYGKLYALKKHNAGLEGAMIGVGLVLVVLAAIPSIRHVQLRTRARKSN